MRFALGTTNTLILPNFCAKVNYVNLCMLDNTDKQIIYEIFEDDYDGRKISLKYFIDLCIRFLEKQRHCCLESKKRNYPPTSSSV